MFDAEVVESRFLCCSFALLALPGSGSGAGSGLLGCLELISFWRLWLGGSGEGGLKGLLEAI